MMFIECFSASLCNSSVFKGTQCSLRKVIVVDPYTKRLGEVSYGNVLVTTV